MRSLQSYSPCRSLFCDISSNGVLNLWDTSTGELKHQYGEPDRLNSTFTSIAWFQPSTTSKKRKRSQNGQSIESQRHGYLALGKDNGNITVWDLSTGNRIALGNSTKVHKPITSLTFIDGLDTPTLVSMHKNSNECNLWTNLGEKARSKNISLTAATPEFLDSLHVKCISAHCFQDTCTIALGSTRVAIFTMNIEEITKPNPSTTFLCEVSGHEGGVDTLGFSTDCQKLITSSEHDRAPAVWCLPTTPTSKLIRSPLCTLSTGGTPLAYTGMSVATVYLPMNNENKKRKKKKPVHENHVAIVTKNSPNIVQLFKIPHVFSEKKKSKGKPLKSIAQISLETVPEKKYGQLSIASVAISLSHSVNRKVNGRVQFSCSRENAVTPVFSPSQEYQTWRAPTETDIQEDESLKGKKLCKFITKMIDVDFSQIVGLDRIAKDEEIDEEIDEEMDQVEMEAERLANKMNHEVRDGREETEFSGMNVVLEEEEEEEEDDDDDVSIGEKASRFMNAMREQGVIQDEPQDEVQSKQDRMDAKARAHAFLKSTSQDLSKQPMSVSLVRVLSQALQAGDDGMLEYCLRNEDKKVIQATIERLQPSDVLPLLRMVIGKLEARPRRAKILVVWINAVLKFHAGYKPIYSFTHLLIELIYSLNSFTHLLTNTFTH